MASAKFSVVVTPVGATRVLVDLGEGPCDIHDQVLGGTLQWQQGQPTVLSLHLSAAGHLEGEGLTELVAPPGEEASAAVVAFLSTVDADDLHRQAMNDSANDASRGIAHAHLAQLIRAAGGEP